MIEYLSSYADFLMAKMETQQFREGTCDLVHKLVNLKF